MASKLGLTLCLVLVPILFIGSNNAYAQTQMFKVTDFGAIPDGTTDNAKAFALAWENACRINGGILGVPNGVFFLSSAIFNGPCIGSTFFTIQGAVIASSGIGNPNNPWITFSRIDGLIISGGGTFNGNGEMAWRYKKGSGGVESNQVLPFSIMLDYVSNGQISGITSMNSKMFHIVLSRAQNFLVDNVRIIAPGDSPNTDGIHISQSSNIRVSNSYIATGDDCVSIADGSSNIFVTSVQCGPGHGISIGSLGQHPNEQGVAEVHVSNCRFSNTVNGLRIKTWAQSSVQTTVSNVTFTDIRVDNVENPIIVDQHYCPHNKCSQQGESGIRIKNVVFARVVGTSSSQVGVKLDCSVLVPCMNIMLQGLDLVVAGSGQPMAAQCLYADAKFIGPQVPSHC